MTAISVEAIHHDQSAHIRTLRNVNELKVMPCAKACWRLRLYTGRGEMQINLSSFFLHKKTAGSGGLF
ncbi:hypothetical protein CQW29_18450 [Pantoea coffeiphila]|uniref:Uncharacterized protein n=1 Tax=Pantoea coffeiphila TaxID=1465635 RepID=A0A2S9I860_9GAMM|nr:hypothetical protein CQW29_18450 [Pantoea coffeiphila]